MADQGLVRVTVLYSPAPRRVLEWSVTIQPGADVFQVLQASSLAAEVPDLKLAQAAVAVWGRKAGLQQRVREGDRIEVLRALRVDPKSARRERFRKQGARAAGLFTRPGGAAESR